jgi:hypothetical protein
MGVLQHGPCDSEREDSGGGGTLNNRSAVLWVTHVWSPELEAEFQTLLRLEADVWLLLDRRTPGAADLAAQHERHHLFDEIRLFELPFPRLPGHGLINHPHFSVLDFFRSHPVYDRYSVIEYDVRYSGDWSHFFRSVEFYGHDLITSHIRRYADEPRWPWWSTLQHPSKRIPRERYLRSFNVIYGVSRAALEFLQTSLIDGWQGYPEVSFPTLLSEGGFRLLDLGGHGDFTPPELRNRFYTSWATSSGYLSPFGTMRYRPARAVAGRLPDKLYHPVKPRHLLESWPQRVKLAALWARELGAHVLTSAV